MNTKVIVATMVIAGAGIANAWINNRPITTVVVGSYVFMLILSIIDIFGGGLSQLASALAMLAMTFVIITEFPWKQIITTTQGKKA